MTLTVDRPGKRQDMPQDIRPARRRLWLIRPGGYTHFIGTFARALMMLLMLAGLSQPLLARADGTQDFVDDVGRHVAVPMVINRIFVAGPPAAVLLYTMAPEKLLGWSQKLSDPSKALIAPPYADLLVYGRLTGHGQTVDPATLRQLHPDLILDVGDIDPAYAALADKVQQQTGIPYVLLNGHLDQSGATYRRLGALIGATARGNMLADEADRILQDLPKAIAAAGAPARPKIYYGRGDDGLQSAGSGSINLEMLALAGADNALATVLPGKLTTVTLAQIQTAQPGAILAQHAAFADKARQDKAWQAVPAVADHHIYVQPLAPFGWADDPPSVNRLLGAQWLAAMLYPQLHWDDMKQVTRAFYQRFYQVKLSDAQLADLLRPSGPSN